MFEYSNDLVHTAISVSSLLLGAYLRPSDNNTSAQLYYEKEQALAIIDELADLKDGWAGPGSLAPSRIIREIAKAAIRTPATITPFPEISAMPNGTIAFDWETEIGAANLEIGADNFSFYLDVEGSFFPLAGPSNILPMISIAEIISYSLSPSAPAQKTQPMSYSEPREVFFSAPPVLQPQPTQPISYLGRNSVAYA
ncbi:hypothetical protein DBR45_25340 [Pseudomonas sp. HMWF031]|nr:hypothetical protein DBR45_25340 [Pseudomonas sp. HMWF031]